MEAKDNKKGLGPSKMSKKGGKNVKAKRAEEEEARRREAVRERVRDNLDLEKRALQVVECLLVDSVSEDFLLECAWFITSDNYKDAVEERFITYLCGYPLCPNQLGKIPTQQYKISTKTNKVYDITERKSFCSNFCYKASKVFELQISKTPLWLRSHESPPKIALMKRGDGGSLGLEVKLAEMQLIEVDIETPERPDGHPSPQQRSDAAWISHSDSSDSEQEQDFVSSVVSQRPGHRVHWADLPETTDEGKKGGKMERRNKKKGERNEIEIQDQNAEKEGEMRGENTEESLIYQTQCGTDVGKSEPLLNTDQPSGDQEIPEGNGSLNEPNVDQVIPKLNLCTLAEPVTDTTAVPNDPTPTQGKLQPQHITPVSRNSETERGPQADPPSTQRTMSQASHDVTAPIQADDNISQVGMSKRGAEGLRDFLEHHPATKPDSIRQHFLDGVRRTLREWHTDETLKFLYGAACTVSSPQSNVQEEVEDREELDEDDLEDDVMNEDGGGAVDKHPEVQKRPSAAAPDYETLQKEAQQLELRVKEFYKGTWILPEEAEEMSQDLKVTAHVHGMKDPVLPLVDSHAQHFIQKRITLEKLNSCLRNIVGPLRLTMSDISSDLNNLVGTFRFTNTNIIHKLPGWTLIAVVLLNLLSEVSPLVREALETPTSVEYLNTLIHEFSLQQQDLMSLVQLIKAPTH